METFPQVITVDRQEKGLLIAKNLLYKKVNNQTLLLLSGGSTPKNLYAALAKERKLKPKAVGMVDERSDGSNYKMIGQTGLSDYLKEEKIPFLPILRLHPWGVASDIVGDYDRKIRNLFKHFSQKIAIMGIGEDGHTAGVPAGISNFPSSVGRQFPISNNEDLVIGVDGFPGEFKKRITLTFRALSEMNLLIVLAFGESKKKALKLMFERGSLEEIPARFYTKIDIAKKTILITDQKI